MNLNASSASLLRPRDIRNFGLSGKKGKSAQLRMLGAALMATKTCQACTASGDQRKVSHYC